MAATMEGEDRVMATAQQIVKSLNTSKDVTDDMILIFSSFDNRLSNISDLFSPNSHHHHPHPHRHHEEEEEENEDHFRAAAEKAILRLQSSSLSCWDDSNSHDDASNSHDDASEYLAAVDDVFRLTEHLSLRPHDHDGIVDRAESAIQLAMTRLQDEFRLILTRNTVPLDADRLYGSIRRVSLSFASHDGGDITDFESFVDSGGGGDHHREKCHHERGASLGIDDAVVDPINPDAVIELKEIADRMIRYRFEKECYQIYCTVRREALYECLYNLGVEKLSIEEVQIIDWRSLDEKMKKWVQAVKVIVRVLLPAEKRLCDHIFNGSDLIRDVCFTETSKGCLSQVLKFGEAVAIGRRSSEKLFRILDMYDAMSEALPALQALFLTESGDFLCSEARGVVLALGDAAIGTFAEFESDVRGETSKRPVQGGEIHPLTRYVMNYIKLLVDYSDSLNSLLEGSKEEELEEHLHSTDDDDDSYSLQLGSNISSPLGLRLLSLISLLESNLKEKSILYEETAMKYVFLMNNILYIVQKVKGSELGKLLGDQWVCRRRSQVRKYATSYLRASWSKVLSCLKDEGIGGSTGNASKVALKERFKSFNASFEDIYRIQTGWKVPDLQLRVELRISVSEKVLPAYRSFMGRFGHQLESGRHAVKYMKYTPEDLENYLLDLFEGSPNVLHHMRRRSG